MIHVRTWIGDDIAPEDPTIQITLTGRADLLKLQALLSRALNCAPEFGQDWFELSDRLEKFLEQHNIRR
jgi:hypothetical protein